MRQHIAHISLIVDDYDKAIAFYTKKLDFTLQEDLKLDAHKRWVIVKPKGAQGTGILLVKATTTSQKAVIGNQTGGAVFLFLYTDDFWRDYNSMKERGITFQEVPREEPYGTVVVFNDLYGNSWDLLEPK